MRAVDTNVLVRVLVRDDAAQTASAEEFIAPGAWVPLLVLAEAIWVLGSTYGLTAGEQATSIQMLLDHRQFVLDSREAVSAALDLFRAKPSLGFSDCLVIESSRKAGHLPLGTFDRALAKVPGSQRV